MSNETTNPTVGEQANVQLHELVLSDQSLEKVTVYADRAEVVRFVDVEFGVGLNELRLTKTPQSVDRDAIRVEGKGDASIVEVSLNEQWVAPQETNDTNDQLKRMRDELEKLQQEEQALLKHIVRLSAKENYLNNYAQSVTKFDIAANKLSENDQNQPAPRVLMAPDAFQSLSNFLELLQVSGATIDQETSAKNREKKLVQQKIDALKRNIQDLEPQGGQRERREIVVLVDAKTASKVRLRVSYLVYGASWSASYDVRASSTDAAIQLHYYAQVHQTTGEEWKDAELVLSTAKPAVSGRLPRLGTRYIKFREPPPPPPPVLFNSVAPQAMPMRMMMAKSMTAPRGGNSNLEEAFGFGAAGGMQADDVPDMTYAASNVVNNDQQFNIAFVIARRTTIPSDATARKVTIGIVNVDADLLHKSVPRKSPFAFITAKIRNTSNMALLAGPSNVFIDNSFVSKSNIDAVAPGEEFVVSLGVDAGVRIEYKPLRKFHEQAGSLFSRPTQRDVYEQNIEIVNGRQNKIRLFVEDQLPKSNEEKIKVSLTEPQLSSLEAGAGTSFVTTGGTKVQARATDKSNIEWELVVRPNEKVLIPFKYQVEYPNEKELTEYEKL